MHCMWTCESWTLNTSLPVRRVKGQSRSRSRGSSALDDVTKGFSHSLFPLVFSTQSVICPRLDKTMANHLPGTSSDPTVLLHHGSGTVGLKKVFDRHHGDDTEAQRGGRVGQWRPSGEDYTQYLQLAEQRWWIWFLIKTCRHKLKSEKKTLSRVEIKQQKQHKKQSIRCLEFSHWNIWCMKNTNSSVFFPLFCFYNVEKNFLWPPSKSAHQWANGLKSRESSQDWKKRF